MNYMNMEKEKEKFVDEKGQPIKRVEEYKDFNFRDYQLTYEEWNFLKDFNSYWESQKNYKSVLKSNDFELIKSNFIEWTLKFLRQKYPDVKMKELEYKQSIIISADLGMTGKNIDRDVYLPKDTIAFKFKKDRPELYLLISDIPSLLHEQIFDAYILGPYKRPIW